MERTLTSRDRANRLFDAYGALLTAQQRRLLQRYYQDDLSLGEIAGQMRISRQAVHDGLRRALVALERYETALELVSAPAEHYFTERPRSALKTREVTATLRGHRWTFLAASGVFSSHAVDAGSRLLIETMRIGRDDRVLDLGCGYGPIGLVAASLAPRGSACLVDINARAAAFAAANAARHLLRNAHVVVAEGASAVQDGMVDVVVTNPPIRAGRRVVGAFIEGAWRTLRPGGRFYLVARTAQGAQTLARIIAERFGEAHQVAAQGGFRVYEATRNRALGHPRGPGSAATAGHERRSGHPATAARRRKAAAHV